MLTNVLPDQPYSHPRVFVLSPKTFHYDRVWPYVMSSKYKAWGEINRRLLWDDTKCYWDKIVSDSLRLLRIAKYA